MNFLKMRLPHHMQQRILIFKLAQRNQASVNIALPRQQRVRKYRLKHRIYAVRLFPESSTGKCSCQARNGTHGASNNRIDRSEFRAGIHTHLIGLLMPHTIVVDFRLAKVSANPRSAGKHRLRLEFTTRYLKPCQAIALRIVRYLIYTRTEFAVVLRLAHIPLESCDELVNTVHFQRGSEETREQDTISNHLTNGFILNRSAFQIQFHGGFALHGDIFHNIGKRRIVIMCSGEIDAAIRETLLQLIEQFRFVSCGSIHFIDEDESGHVVTFQQSP